MAEGDKNNIVAGFQFGSDKDAELAKAEQQKVITLENRMDYSNIDTVLAIYDKAIENRIFQTPVGYAYLQKLQLFLKEQGIENERLKNIPLYNIYSANMNLRQQTAPARQRITPSKVVENKLKLKLKISQIINIVLVIMVIAMFAITIKSDNPNILNYETAITNKYATWEQELRQRETNVREKERELSIDYEEPATEDKTE